MASIGWGYAFAGGGCVSAYRPPARPGPWMQPRRRPPLRCTLQEASRLGKALKDPQAMRMLQEYAQETSDPAVCRGVGEAGCYAHASSSRSIPQQQESVSSRGAHTTPWVHHAGSHVPLIKATPQRCAWCRPRRSGRPACASWRRGGVHTRYLARAHSCWCQSQDL